MEDGIPLIFQQLPTTTGFLQSPGHFFLKPLVVMARIEEAGGKNKKKN